MTAAADRPLGATQAVALVIANMIGTGVFTTSGFLLRDLGTRGAVLAAWLAGGVLALCGAACYGALARRIPESGGEYLFLGRVLHPAVGYAAGWVSLLVAFSAPLAAAAWAFGGYMQWNPRWAGSGLLLAAAAVHAADVRRGAWLQTLGVALVLASILGFLLLAAAGDRSSAPSAPAARPWAPLPFALAVLWVSYSYSGWNAAVYLGGEVRDAARVVPRALLLGAAAVMLLYLLVNAAFLWAAPPAALSGQLAVGRIAAEHLGGPTAARAFSMLIALALCTFVSSMMMVGPRVLAAMAADGYLPRALRGRAGAPPRSAVLVQVVLALALLWSATYEALLTYVGFTLSLSTTATVAALLVLRRREGAAAVPVLGWPLTPILFLSGTLIAAALSAWQRPLASACGAASAAAGVAFWWLTAAPSARRAAKQVER